MSQILDFNEGGVVGVVTITSSTVLDSSYWNKKILFNSATPITVTFPQQSTLATAVGVNFECENISAGDVTIATQGAETLSGNALFASGASGSVFRNTTTSIGISGGTSILTWQQTFAIETAANNAYNTIQLNFTGTLTSISTIARTGTCTATTAINGVNVTATANAVSTSNNTQAVTGNNTFLAANSYYLRTTISSNSGCQDILITYTGTLKQNI